MDIPFGDEVMTIIMGIEDPAAPGQHGPCRMPEMDPEAVNVLTKIRDLCDEYLMGAGKTPADDGKPDMQAEDDEED
jgi:hypothetical protein